MKWQLANRPTVVATGAIAAAGQTAEAIVLDGGTEVARASGFPGVPMSIAIPKAKLWWPETPFLYDLRITLKQDGKIIDAVGSYFGMRKISIGPDKKGITRILLNNQFIFQNGLLDQGYWPDGVYTAPTDEALRYDVEMTRKLGYNMLRKHVKVEPDRWYYWTTNSGCSSGRTCPRRARLPGTTISAAMCGRDSSSPIPGAIMNRNCDAWSAAA